MNEESGLLTPVENSEEAKGKPIKREIPGKPSPRVLMAPGMNRCIACYSCMLACARAVYRSFSLKKSAIRIRTLGGYHSKFYANICRACIDPPCAKACCVSALMPRPGGGVRFNRDVCLGCRSCAAACVVQCIEFDEVERKPIICIQCGNCVKFCPHECITMEISPHVEYRHERIFPQPALKTPPASQQGPNSKPLTNEQARMPGEVSTNA